MIKKEKGIALVSLIIVVILMTIISSTVVYISLDRFEINNIRKMYTDIELLEDKISNYYLKYGVFPILRDNSNLPIKYTYSTLDFETNILDNDNYYIIDLEAMEGIALNYGRKGFEEPNISTDVYIINEASHVIYYVKGIVLNEEKYHTLITSNNSSEDTVPPSSPQIKVASGEKYKNGGYITNIELEFVPGVEKISKVEITTYSINGGTEIDITTLENNIYTIKNEGTHEITLKSYDSAGNYSQVTATFEKMELITFEVDGDELSTVEGMTWREWFKSPLNDGTLYTEDVFGDGYQVICSNSGGDTIGCTTCTKRQRVTYNGEDNHAGYCWYCGKYSEFDIFPA